MIEYLSREDQEKLRGVLREIPELVENLAAAIAKPYEAISYQPRVSTGEREQPLPYNPSAEDASKYLRKELEWWVYWLSDCRGLSVPSTDITTLARWLVDHMSTLATTHGSESAYANIASEVKAAKRATGRQERAQPKVDNSRLEAARGQELNASGIAAVAVEVQVHGLTRRRVHMLAENGHITPVRTYGKTPIYLLGDVLDAHYAVPQRQRFAG